MVKNENFGIVSVKHLNKPILLSFVLVGCSSPINSQLAEKQWNERFDYCQESAVTNKASIPDSEWFDSLINDDKKTVIGYLANYADRTCMSTATKTLRNSLLAEDNREKLDFYSIDLQPLDELSAERIKHLNKEELKHLKEQVNKPFNIRYVLTEEGLYPK